MRYNLGLCSVSNVTDEAPRLTDTHDHGHLPRVVVNLDCQQRAVCDYLWLKRPSLASLGNLAKIRKPQAWKWEVTFLHIQSTGICRVILLPPLSVSQGQMCPNAFCMILCITDLWSLSSPFNESLNCFHALTLRTASR